MTVDLIIPTLGQIKKTTHPYTCFERLSSLPFPIRLHVVNKGKTWAQAINIGLKQTDGNNDVILMDDDVFVNEHTFDGLGNHLDQADIFGFKLLFPEGKIQHFGGIVKNGSIGHIGWGEDDGDKFSDPIYACHATTSLVYIKRHVIDELKGMAEDIPGIQMEDVDFSFRAIKAGFQIMILPQSAIHMESATKRYETNFAERIGEAFAEISKRHLSDAEFVKTLESYPKPVLSVVNARAVKP